MVPIIGAAFLPHPPIVIPEIGKGNEREATKTLEGIHAVAEQVQAIEPDVILVITPHGQAGDRLVTVNTNPVLAGSLSAFGHPELKWEWNNDLSLVKELLDVAESHELSLSGIRLSLDHGALVPLSFIMEKTGPLPVVHLSAGWDSLETVYETGEVLWKILHEDKRRLLILASGDLSHRLKKDGPYGFHPKGPEFDAWVREAFEKNRLDDLKEIPARTIDAAGQCGLVPFVLAAGMIKPLQPSVELFSYEGPFGVGYLCAFAASFNGRLHHPAVDLARQAIKTYLQEEKWLNFEDYLQMNPEEPFLQQAQADQAGVFVSLHAKGKLRGCIGTIESTRESMGLEIIANAIQAATADPRFNPVEIGELDDIDVKVDVMGSLELVSDPDQLDVQTYGVVVESGYRRGLLLPALEGVETVDQQIAIACQKAGIENHEEFRIYRFKVTRYH